MKLPVRVRKGYSSNPFFDAKYIIEDADERYVGESTKESAANHIAIVLNSHGALLDALVKLVNALPDDEVELAREVWGNSNTVVVRSRIEAARAAITKARGNSPSVSPSAKEG